MATGTSRPPTDEAVPQGPEGGDARVVAVRNADPARRSVVRLFADEPELLDEVTEHAMLARERDPLRRTNA